MKTNINKQTKLMAMIIAIVVGVITFIAWPSSRQASAQQYQFLAYGVVNISPGQTARLHVVTVGIPDVQPAELVIYDRMGNTLTRSSERLLPGRAVALDLRFDEQNVANTAAVVGNRLQFYAEVRFAKQHTGYVIPSLEVIDDATGKTILMVLDPLG